MPEMRGREGEMMRVLDLFSGIGAMSLGLERAGMRTIAFCEINTPCRKLLAEKWPEVPCHDDVRTMVFPDADIIAAGFPCQDISVAGKGAGISGKRSGLYREVMRAVCVVQPQWVLLENVAALLVRGMGAVLRDLSALGYDAEWHCIPASALGAPHRRDRVWIVAYPNGSRESQPARGVSEQRDGSGRGRGDMAYPDGPRLEIRKSFASHDGEERTTALGVPWWPAEPEVGRTVSHGFAGRVVQLHALGNSLVPQIAELIGRAILTAEATS